MAAFGDSVDRSGYPARLHQEHWATEYKTMGPQIYKAHKFLYSVTLRFSSFKALKLHHLFKFKTSWSLRVSTRNFDTDSVTINQSWNKTHSILILDIVFNFKDKTKVRGTLWLVSICSLTKMSMFLKFIELI